MPSRIPESVYHHIREFWARSQLEPGFAVFLKEAIESSSTQAAGQDSEIPAWAHLPEYCCQAAGGAHDLAEPLTSAWLLFNIAAHLMDAVEDRDEPDAWWAEYGAGVAVNIASGLFFSAAEALSQLFDRENTRAAAAEVSSEFYAGFLRMCGGQHLDLVWQQPALDLYWRIASGKSGNFFGLVCWGAARLAGAEVWRCDAMRGFGQNLGVLVQIRDDLEDYQNLSAPQPLISQQKIRRSLPFVYAWEVSPADKREELLVTLHSAMQDASKITIFLDQIDRTGAATYVAAEMERYRSLANQALDKAEPLQPFAEALRKFLT